MRVPSCFAISEKHQSNEVGEIVRNGKIWSILNSLPLVSSATLGLINAANQVKGCKKEH
jgi:hypothetical protein